MKIEDMKNTPLRFAWRRVLVKQGFEGQGAAEAGGAGGALVSLAAGADDAPGFLCVDTAAGRVYRLCHGRRLPADGSSAGFPAHGVIPPYGTIIIPSAPKCQSNYANNDN